MTKKDIQFGVIDKYKRVIINNEQIPVHRIVGETWLKGYKENYTIEHIDQNTRNNCVKNLQWVPGEENLRRSYNNEFLRKMENKTKEKEQLGKTKIKNERREYYKNQLERIQGMNLTEKIKLNGKEMTIYEITKYCYEMTGNEPNKIMDYLIKMPADNIPKSKFGCFLRKEINTE